MMLDVMSDIDRYARENGIRYYLAYGTLLGAIRHNGFIPWDDDIDIWMPRPDYDRFVREYDHPVYKVICSANDKEYPLDYAKVHDPRTLIIEKGGDGDWGVNVDIFPIDGFPTPEAGSRLFSKLTLMRRLAANQRFTRKGRVRKSNGLAKNLAVIAGKILHPFISLNGILLWMDREMKRHDFDSCDYFGCLCDREIQFSKSVLGTAEHVFEGRSFKTPADFDAVLSATYGDYMQLPPEEKRHSLHGSKIYLK